MNWSLIINAVLLMGVLAVLYRTLKKKEGRVTASSEEFKPSLGNHSMMNDDIISVRRIDPGNDDILLDERAMSSHSTATHLESVSASRPHHAPAAMEKKILMIFLLAKPNRQLAGYEMLQTLLAAGLRFGEGDLFHCHQNTSGQGPILCSLAAATASGTFDLQNIGAFNSKGLCLFMHLSGSPELDSERLDKMIDTAQQLAEGLDTFLLDDDRKPFTNETKARYRHILETTQ